MSIPCKNMDTNIPAEKNRNRSDPVRKRLFGSNGNTPPAIHQPNMDSPGTSGPKTDRLPRKDAG